MHGWNSTRLYRCWKTDKSEWALVQLNISLCIPCVNNFRPNIATLLKVTKNNNNDLPCECESPDSKYCTKRQEWHQNKKSDSFWVFSILFVQSIDLQSFQCFCSLTKTFVITKHVAVSTYTSIYGCIDNKGE